MSDVIEHDSASRPGGLIPIIERAIQSTDVDVAKIERLLDAYDRYNRIEAERAFVRAMTAFRRDCPAIIKRGTTVVSKQGHTAPFAKLSDAAEAIKKPLADNGLSYRWKTTQSDGLITVTCRVTHEDGHSEETTLSAPPETSGSKNPVQAIGSAVAYLERYTLFGALGLAAEDDDGKAAGGDAGLVSDSQLADMVALKDEVGDALPADALKAWLRDTIGAEDGRLENVPATKFKKVIATLEKYRNGDPNG